GEHAARGHHLAQMPPVVEFARHSALLPAPRWVVVERWAEGLAQRGVHEVARYVGVNGRGSIAAVPNSLLNEPPIYPVLGQVCHPRVPKTMRGKGFRQPERIAVGDEAGVDLRLDDTATAFGQPHRRMLLATEAGPNVVDVVGDRLHR